MLKKIMSGTHFNSWHIVATTKPTNATTPTTTFQFFFKRVVFSGVSPGSVGCRRRETLGINEALCYRLLV